MNEQPYPHAWAVEVVRNEAGRAWYFVSRFVSRAEVQYMLKGFSDEPARFRRRKDADEIVAKLNTGSRA